MKLYIYGAACVLAVIFALCARDDRRVIITCAVAILANWIACAMPWIYAPASFEFVTAANGFRHTQEEGWAMFDLTALAVTGWTGRKVWWGMVIPCAYMAMLVMASVASSLRLEYQEYSLINDIALCIALAVIFARGERGVRDRVRSGWRVHIAPRLSVLGAHLAGERR